MLLPPQQPHIGSEVHCAVGPGWPISETVSMDSVCTGSNKLRYTVL